MHIFVLLLFSSCTDSADQVVHQEAPYKQFIVDELVDEFKFDNTSSLKENVISVEGIVDDINFLNNRNTVVLRGKDTSKTLIICDMQKEYAGSLNKIKQGDTVTIKGILKGSLKDIILLNCILSNETN